MKMQKAETKLVMGLNSCVRLVSKGTNYNAEANIKNNPNNVIKLGASHIGNNSINQFQKGVKSLSRTEYSPP